jgi:hypothetical protein
MLRRGRQCENDDAGRDNKQMFIAVRMNIRIADKRGG